MDLNSSLPLLLGTAWLLPLVSFALILLFGPWMGKAGRGDGFCPLLRRAGRMDFRPSD
jgi:hypothetical protein